jgi:transposase-like protein
MAAAWLLRWQEKYPKLCVWVEENIEESITNILRAPICLSGSIRI